MGQRVRKVSATLGQVYFYYGVNNQLVEDFLKANNITRVSGKEDDINEKFVTVYVPVAEEYKIPDHVYTWVCVESQPDNKVNNNVTKTPVASADTTIKITRPSVKPKPVEQETKSVSADSNFNPALNIHETVVFYGVILKNTCWVRERVVERSLLKYFKKVKVVEKTDFPVENNPTMQDFYNNLDTNFVVLEDENGGYCFMREDCFWFPW